MYLRINIPFLSKSIILFMGDTFNNTFWLFSNFTSLTLLSVYFFCYLWGFTNISHINLTFSITYFSISVSHGLTSKALSQPINNPYFYLIKASKGAMSTLEWYLLLKENSQKVKYLSHWPPKSITHDLSMSTSNWIVHFNRPSTCGGKVVLRSNRVPNSDENFSQDLVLNCVPLYK